MEFSMENGRINVKIYPHYKVGNRTQKRIDVNGKSFLTMEELKNEYPLVYKKIRELQK